jgi:hypothetical protein
VVAIVVLFNHSLGWVRINILSTSITYGFCKTSTNNTNLVVSFAFKCEHMSGMGWNWIKPVLALHIRLRLFGTPGCCGQRTSISRGIPDGDISPRSEPQVAIFGGLYSINEQKGSVRSGIVITSMYLMDLFPSDLAHDSTWDGCSWERAYVHSCASAVGGRVSKTMFFSSRAGVAGLSTCH